MAVNWEFDLGNYLVGYWVEKWAMLTAGLMGYWMVDYLVEKKE